MQAGKCHSPLTTFSPWIPCRSYSDSCFLDSSLYPELADVQWCGQEKAKPGTLVWASGLNLTASMPFWDHLTASHLPYPDALSPCTSFDPQHFSSPVSASPHSKNWLRRHSGRFRSHCVSPGSLAYREPGTYPQWHLGGFPLPWQPPGQEPSGKLAGIPFVWTSSMYRKQERRLTYRVTQKDY